jgi:hypothetical protein
MAVEVRAEMSQGYARPSTRGPDPHGARCWKAHKGREDRRNLLENAEEYAEAAVRLWVVVRLEAVEAVDTFLAGRG